MEAHQRALSIALRHKLKAPPIGEIEADRELHTLLTEIAYTLRGSRDPSLMPGTELPYDTAA